MTYQQARTARGLARRWAALCARRSETRQTRRWFFVTLDEPVVVSTWNGYREIWPSSTLSETAAPCGKGDTK